MEIIKVFFSLLKFKVSLAVTFTAVTGFLISSGQFDLTILFLMAGVFLIAGGASAFNQIIERKEDAQMERTMNRPLPSGRITSYNALWIAFLVSIAGSLILYFYYGWIPSLLSIFNLLWYVLIYTRLKKISPFAVIPGALTGAVPAFIGWTAAGENIFDQRIILIGFFLFIWQIPHFWLLLLKYNDQYVKAGYPSIHNTLSKDSFKKITLVWIVATSVVSLMFPVLNVIHSIPLNVAIILLNLAFVTVFLRLTFSELTEMSFKRAFISMNAYMFLIMTAIVAYYIFR